jgi:glutathione S-transferase
MHAEEYIAPAQANAREGELHRNFLHINSQNRALAQQHETRAGTARRRPRSGRFVTSIRRRIIEGLSLWTIAMYTLYYAPGSANLVVHLALLEIGAPHTLERIDFATDQQHSAAYLAINPHGVVPTLVIDGVPHGEAPALAMLVVERHPEAALAPAPGSAQRADYLQWMFYLANNLQPLFRQMFFPNDHLPEAADSLKQASRIGIEKCWSYIDAHLASHGPYMLGETFSVVDWYVLMLMRWSRNMPKPATEWPHLAAFATRLKARPSWKQVCVAEGLTEWA